MKRKFLSKKFAFTLIEILIAVVVLGIILLALVPTMISKAKNKTISIASSTSSMCGYQGENFDVHCCRAKKGKGCVTCDWKCVRELSENGCGKGYYIHPYSCTCEKCPSDCSECVYDSKQCKAVCLNGTNPSDDDSICDNSQGWYSLKQIIQQQDPKTEALHRYIDDNGQMIPVNPEATDYDYVYNSKYYTIKSFYGNEAYYINVKNAIVACVDDETRLEYKYDSPVDPNITLDNKWIICNGRMRTVASNMSNDLSKVCYKLFLYANEQTKD